MAGKQADPDKTRPDKGRPGNRRRDKSGQVGASGMSVGTLIMANIGLSLNNFFFSVNSLRWVQVESIQRRSLAPIR